jgi:signal transduction histidine kinase
MQSPPAAQPRHPDLEIRLLQALALDIGQAEDLDQALSSTLREIGRATGWATGESWLPDPRGRVLVRGPVWGETLRALAPFHAVSDGTEFAPGSGLPGRVWAEGVPRWVGNIARDPEFRRAGVAAAVGLRTAAAIPVLAGREVVAVLVFYHFEERPHDARLIELVSAVAAQLGMLVRRRRAEDALLRQAEELARANVELERFIWLATHELNEPVRMVALYTQWLAERCAGRLSEEEREAVEFARGGAERMHALLDAFRVYAEAGAPVEAPGAVALDEALDRALAAVQAPLRESRAEVARGPLPAVIGGAAELAFVFEQLLTNALTFRDPAVAPRVEISAEARDAGWTVSVRDNGIGVAAGKLAHVFDPFPRLHARGAYPGRGVGLASCRKIVEGFGGRIWMESEEGAGSTVHFSLPAAGDAATPAPSSDLAAGRAGERVPVLLA